MLKGRWTEEQRELSESGQLRRQRAEDDHRTGADSWPAEACRDNDGVAPEEAERRSPDVWVRAKLPFS